MIQNNWSSLSSWISCKSSEVASRSWRQACPSCTQRRSSSCCTTSRWTGKGRRRTRSTSSTRPSRRTSAGATPSWRSGTSTGEQARATWWCAGGCLSSTTSRVNTLAWRRDTMIKHSHSRKSMLNSTLWAPYTLTSRVIKAKASPFWRPLKPMERTARSPTSKNSSLGLSLPRMYAW